MEQETQPLPPHPPHTHPACRPHVMKPSDLAGWRVPFQCLAPLSLVSLCCGDIWGQSGNTAPPAPPPPPRQASGFLRHPEASSTSGRLAGDTANIWGKREGGRQGGRGGRKLRLPGSQGQSPGPGPDTLVSRLGMCVRVRAYVHVCEFMHACVHIGLCHHCCDRCAHVCTYCARVCVCVHIGMCVLCVKAVCLRMWV